MYLANIASRVLNQQRQNRNIPNSSLCLTYTFTLVWLFVLQQHLNNLTYKSELANNQVVKVSCLWACQPRSQVATVLPSASVDDTNVKSPLVGENCIVVVVVVFFLTFHNTILHICVHNIKIFCSGMSKGASPTPELELIYCILCVSLLHC